MRLDRQGLAEARDQAEVIAALAAAAEAGLLTVFARGATLGAAEAATRAGLDARATGALLAFLADAGVLEREGPRYRAAEGARAALFDPETPGYAAGGLPHWLGALRAFTQLGDVLRTGQPVASTGGSRDEAGLQRFMAAMAAAPRERVERIVALCLARRPEARTALDVGGGPGHMSRALAARGVRTTLLDRPETVAWVGRELGLAQVEGVELAGADFLVDPLPQGPFDLVLVSNVLHIYGPEQNRRLLAKVAEVTRPGGAVAIVDFVEGLSPRASRFALMMLLRTESGGAWSEAEYRGWLEAAGFAEVRVDDVDGERQMVSALRGSAPGG